MTLEELAGRVPQWLAAAPDADGTVISSRIRLARNVRPHRFVHRTAPEGLEQVLAQAAAAAGESGAFRDGLQLAVDGLDDNGRTLLVERHLASPAFVKAGPGRGLYASADEKCALMVNEEDHLRLQALEPGMDLLTTWNTVSRLDDELNRTLEYAYDARLGYLTTCPTNTGTGMRASILIHLPALVLTREIDKVLRGIGQVGLTVRGVYGEGSDVTGNLFQISNQTTLGQSEEDVIGSIEQIVQQIIEYERKARETLMRDARPQMEDKIWRAWGILRNARMLSSHEYMNLSSAVRLGVNLGVVTGVSAARLNELLVLTRPAHVRTGAAGADAAERDRLRAAFVRARLADGGDGNG